MKRNNDMSCSTCSRNACPGKECFGRLYIETFGLHRCDWCDLIKAYKKAVDAYLDLFSQGRKKEAEQLLKDEIMPMVEEQTRFLKGGDL